MPPPESFLRGFAWTAAVVLPCRLLDLQTLVGFIAGVVAGVSWCKLRASQEARAVQGGAGPAVVALSDREAVAIIVNGNGEITQASAAAASAQPTAAPTAAHPACVVEANGAEGCEAAAGSSVASAAPPWPGPDTATGTASSSTSVPRPVMRPALKARPVEVPCFDLRAFWSLLASKGTGTTKSAGAAPRRRVTFAQLVQAQMSNGTRVGSDAQDAHAAGSAAPAQKQSLKHGNHLLWDEQGASHKSHTSLRHLRSWLCKGPRRFRLQESVGWLDELMQDVWPHLAIWLKAKVVQVVEPAINSLLPPFLQGAHFEELSFGNQPPTLGPLSLYSTEDKAGIEIRLGVKLVSDMTAWLSAVGLRLGISKVKLEGTLSLVFRPLRDWPPFFSGMEIYLMNPPTLEFEFHGAGKIAEFPTIRPLVRNTIATLIANRLVLPNRIAVDMDEEDETDIADLKKSDPHLILRLEVVRARALLAADVGLLGPSSSDPYVVVTLGATRHTSPVIMRNLNPEWNFTADFPVHDPSQLMYFSVYDQDHYTADDLIGVASGIALGSLVDEGEVAVPLESPQGEEGAGTLTVRGRYLELTQESKSSAGAYLAVKVRQVRGLPQGADFPYKVVASAAGVEGATKGSYAPQGRAVSLDMQAICAKLLGEGRSREVVAQILGLDVKDVLRILNRRSPNDPALQKAVQDAMKEGAARNPQFEDVVQLLLPDAQAVLGPCMLHLRLLNRQNALVAQAAIELKRVKEAPNMRLEGPFVLTKPSGDHVAELLGSVRFRFSRELEGESFSLMEAA